MFDRDLIPNQCPGYVLDKLDGGLILRHGSSAAACQINETAALIWRLCDGERCIEEIIVLIQDLYPDSSDDIAADVAAAIGTLVEQQALCFEGQQPPSQP